MPAVEHDRFSSVRVVREVLPTPELEKFLARVADIGMRLGDKDSTSLRQAVTLDEELAPGYEPRMRGIGITALAVHKANQLRSTLFEWRMPRSQRANSYLLRLSNRLSVLDLNSLDNERPTGELTADARYLIESTRPQYGKLVREFGIVLEEGPTHARFMAESGAYYKEGTKRAGRADTRSFESENIPDPTVIPILTLPAKTEGSKVQQFIEEVNEFAFEPSIHLGFEDPEVVVKLR